LVVEAFTRWRNMGVNFIIVCQDASMVATSCRNCTNMRALFNSASQTALRTFNKDIVDRVADPDAYHELIRYVCSIPFSYLLIRENPLEIAVGKGVSTRRVMSDTSVEVPTYRELMRELGAKSPSEMTRITRGLQQDMGNTAHQLGGGPGGDGGIDRGPRLAARNRERDPDSDSSDDDGWHQVRR
jgi:hypothetical protein